jgi:hypothetical protein
VNPCRPRDIDGSDEQELAAALFDAMADDPFGRGVSVEELLDALGTLVVDEAAI